MASVSKPFRLINPGRRRNKRRNRRMTAKQIKYFGTARQRAALRANRRRNAGKFSKRKTKKRIRTYERKHGLSKSDLSRSPFESVRRMVSKRSNRRRRNHRRRANVGEILTVFNPGRRSMARHRRRSNRGLRLFSNRRRRRNRRRNYGTRFGRSWSTFSSKSRPAAKRRRNPYRRHYRMNRRHYRRNPFFEGAAGKVVGVIGGAAVTKLLTETLGNMVSMLSSGFPLYIAGAVIAFLQGNMIGKMMKKPSLGQDMQIGGFTYVALKAMTDLLPSIPLPFGVSGLGLITTAGSWGPPWVPVNGSMTRFVRPGGLVAGIPAPVVTPATGMHGLGRTRRIGRLA